MQYPCVVIGCLALTLSCTSAVAASGWTALGHDVLLQNKTGLQWTRSDNGRDINWSDAGAYCTKRGDGWRLPSVDELRSVYATAVETKEMAPCGDAVCAAPALLQLTSAWHWSGMAVTQEQSYDFQQLAWGLTLVNGRQTMALRFAASASRALCVKNT